ncbi:regulator of Ty1 Transposition [Podospora pseudoanserina]|uniref:Regulator of Ty1 Transposition n=1 Tax=Podospora pseudoanserina TaxID=2609844 RepID=A0ABR0IAW1_9PEZI|nr:regulator of Ty1 Transposition [Podospora pseudoanserina]
MAEQHEKPPLLADCAIAFVQSKQLSSQLISILSDVAREHGAEVLEPDRQGKIRWKKATHIISNTIDFEEYTESLAAMVPVVKSDWIRVSIHRRKLAQLRPYSPDPRMIFSSVTVTCADIPTLDKEAICGGVLALGGMESKDLNKLTTHICALTLEHPKCQEALEKKLKAKIVLPHWFDDCFRLGKRIDEGPYLLPDPEVLRTASEEPVKIPSSQQLEGASSAVPSGPYEPQGGEKLVVFSQKKVLLGDDLPINDSTRKTIGEKIARGGGEVVGTVEECNTFVGHYRDGEQYVRASQMGKDVGNLAWLYYLIVYNEWTSPLRRLLHYPVPREPLPGFKDLKITLSNYGGEARIYLENLVTAAGATYTRTMKAENTHLITARLHSEKCEAAKDWNIEIVNHLWIEESYVACQALALNDDKYKAWPRRTNLGEVIGKTFLDETVLRNLYYPGGEEHMDAAAKKKKRVAAAAQKNALTMNLDKDFGTMQDSFMADSSPAPAAPATAKKGRKPKAAAAAAPTAANLVTPAKGRHLRTGKENDTPPVLSSGSRSAKAAALSKLQDIAPDLALYEKEKRRPLKDGVWGGKRAMDQIDKERSTRSSSPAGHADADDDEEEEETGEKSRPSKRPRLSLPNVTMRICATGYKRWVGNKNLEDSDRKKLRNLGVTLVQDTQPCDYLAAPKVVRTMKFLKCLAKGAEIINTSFLDACLETNKRPPVEDHFLVDEENEKKFNINLGTSVGRARANKGKLLWNVPIYCTADIKNGVENFKAIAEANGAIFKIYRARSGTTIKPTTAEEDGGADPDPVYLLSGTTPGEKALWPKFEEMAVNGHCEPRVVNGDWLLDVAMRQELTFDKKYLWKGQEEAGGGGA